MPGAIGGKNVICSNNDTCVGFGSNWFCAGAVRISSKIVEGVCLPTGEERGVSGTPCLGNKDCRSFLCLVRMLRRRQKVSAQLIAKPISTARTMLCASELASIPDRVLMRRRLGRGFAPLNPALTYCNAQDKCPEGGSARSSSSLQNSSSNTGVWRPAEIRLWVNHARVLLNALQHAACSVASTVLGLLHQCVPEEARRLS